MPGKRLVDSGGGLPTQSGAREAGRSRAEWATGNKKGPLRGLFEIRIDYAFLSKSLVTPSLIFLWKSNFAMPLSRSL